MTRIDRSGLQDFNILNTISPSFLEIPEEFFSSLPCACPEVPLSPLCASIDQNMLEASTRKNPIWFYNQVKNKGPWDYKQKGRYEDFGNFNYGATGSKFGFPDQIILRAAGWAQQRAKTSTQEFGSPWGNPPYGDDPKDQEMIQRRIDYANCSCQK